MPNNRSTAKRVRQTEKRTARNRVARSQVKTAIRHFDEALIEDKTTAESKLREAMVKIDKAASKGIIHKNKAARQKSRLTKKFNKAE